MLRAAALSAVLASAAGQASKMKLLNDGHSMYGHTRRSAAFLLYM